MADDAATQLEKEQMDAARLAEVQAADRRRAEIARQTENESLNRAPELYQNKPAELVEQTKYGGVEKPYAEEEGEPEDQIAPTADEEATRGGDPKSRREVLEQLQGTRIKGAQTGLQRRQQIIRESRTRIEDFNKKIKAAEKKIDSAKTMRNLNCLLMCIPGLGWFAAIIVKIFSTKTKIEATNARAQIEILERRIDAENKKLNSALRREQRMIV